MGYKKSGSTLALQEMMKKLEDEAKVKLKDIKYLKFNVYCMSGALLLLIIGAVVAHIFLTNLKGASTNSKVLDSDFDAKSAAYICYVGAHLGAVLIGLSIFIIIVAATSIMNEYDNAKKQKIIELAAQKNSAHKDYKMRDFFAFALMQLKHR